MHDPTLPKPHMRRADLDGDGLAVILRILSALHKAGQDARMRTLWRRLKMVQSEASARRLLEQYVTIDD